MLSHVQRGAMPTAEDRLLNAAALGVRAVDMLAEGKADRMVAWWNRQVIDVPLEKVVGRSRTVDRDGTLIRTARALGICLGDTLTCHSGPRHHASLDAALQISAAIQNTSPSLCSVSSHGRAYAGRRLRGASPSTDLAQQGAVPREGDAALRPGCGAHGSRPSVPAAKAIRGSWRYSGGSRAMPCAST